MKSYVRSTKKMFEKNVYSVSKLSKEFAENTSMHGLKFIAQDKALLPERILWIILFIIGLFFAIFFSWNLWDNWQTSPILITIQTANYPINKYPFPTVTICSVNKVSTRALGEWMQTPEGKGFKLDDIRVILEIMSTNRVDDEDDVNALNELLIRANITSDKGKYEEIMNKLSPNCTEMITFCSWEGREEDCKTLFETEATDDGFCCSFNSIIIRRGDYSPNNKTLRKARSSGVYAGLTVYLDAEIDDYNVTSSSTSGFKVSIQNPNDFARTGRIGFLASPGSQIDAAVTGQTQISNDTLKAIDLEKRLCVTNNEIKLDYFEEYTGPYCQLDCLTRLFYAKCRCIPYYYPVRADLPVCNLSAYVCLEQVSEYTLSNQSACDCPDTCTNVWYRNEISSGTFPNPVPVYPPTFVRRAKFDGIDTRAITEYVRRNIVKLNVYFKSTYGLCYIMEERTNWTDFISAAGGLLGLGFGFSIISAAELFYFFLIRWCYYWYQSKKQEKEQPVKIPPSYPIIPSYVRNEKARELRAFAQSNKPGIGERLPLGYKTWIRNGPEKQQDYSRRPDLFHAWVDY